ELGLTALVELTRRNHRLLGKAQQARVEDANVGAAIEGALVESLREVGELAHAGDYRRLADSPRAAGEPVGLPVVEGGLGPPAQGPAIERRPWVTCEQGIGGQARRDLQGGADGGHRRKSVRLRLL